MGEQLGKRGSREPGPGVGSVSQEQYKEVPGVLQIIAWYTEHSLAKVYLALRQPSIRHC